MTGSSMTMESWSEKRESWMNQVDSFLIHLFMHDGVWQAHSGMGRPSGLWWDTRQLHAGLTS